MSGGARCGEGGRGSRLLVFQAASFPPPAPRPPRSPRVTGLGLSEPVHWLQVSRPPALPRTSSGLRWSSGAGAKEKLLFLSCHLGLALDMISDPFLKTEAQMFAFPAHLLEEEPGWRASSPGHSWAQCLTSSQSQGCCLGASGWQDAWLPPERGGGQHSPTGPFLPTGFARSTEPELLLCGP